MSGIYEKSKQPVKVGKTPAATRKTDKISISNEARDYQLIMKSLKEIPDMRIEKVKELSEKYQSGNYNVKGNDIAEKILKSTIDAKV